MSAVLLFGIFFALLFLNVPIAMSLGVSSIITTMAVKPAMMSTIAANLYSSTNTYVLLAIPFFILAGNIMDVSGISVRLINFFNSPCRTHKARHRNGLRHRCVLLCGNFRLRPGYRCGSRRNTYPCNE